RVSSILTAFEVTVKPEPEGPWTVRLNEARRQIAETLEGLLLQADRLVARALPLVSAPLVGTMSRKAPDLCADPAGRHVMKARAVLAVLDGAREIAEVVGCEFA